MVQFFSPVGLSATRMRRPLPALRREESGASKKMLVSNFSPAGFAQLLEEIAHAVVVGDLHFGFDFLAHYCTTYFTTKFTSFF